MKFHGPSPRIVGGGDIMWLIPIVILGAFVVAAASRSPRETVPPLRQLPSPGVSGAPPGVPGPIAVLGAFLRRGQYPPPLVILCAIAEAEALGRGDLASDIVSTFVAPVVYRHQREHGRLSCAPVTGAPAYERGSCAPRRSPRESCSSREACFSPAPHAQGRESCSPRESCGPSMDRVQVSYGRESCAPRDNRGSCASSSSPAASQPKAPMAAAPQVTERPPTEEDVFAMLHTDPKAFLDMVAAQPQRRGPLVEIFPIGSPLPTVSAPALSPTPMPTTQVTPASATAEILAAQLCQLPGSMGAGVVCVDPSSGAETFEVRWLRGYEIPRLPEVVEGRPVRIAILDDLPAPQVDLSSEAVAQMQEAVGLYEAADQTRAFGPGSPLAGVPDEGWRQFVALLARESPTFSSSRHVGQYRQRRERLAEFGVDPQAIHGSAAAQRQALDTDLVDAHHHAAAGGILAEHLGRPIAIPGHDGVAMITLSGVLGVIQCAGLDGAVGWLESPNDRKRYPHTTQAFLRTNGVF